MQYMQYVLPVFAAVASCGVLIGFFVAWWTGAFNHGEQR